MNLNLDEVTWEKYRCTSCGRRFLSMAKRPRCPECGAEEVARVQGA